MTSISDLDIYAGIIRRNRANTIGLSTVVKSLSNRRKSFDD
jgi:hypothetical protein